MAGLVTRIFLALIAGGWLYSAASSVRTGPDAPDRHPPARPSTGQTIVLTQAPADRRPAQAAPSGRDLFRPEFYHGARIILLRPDQSRRVLTEGFDSACDPEISFDGTHLLFAGKRALGDSWQIFEMSVDGSEPRQITGGPGNHRRPVYLSTLYTLVSDKPWNQVAYLSDEAGTFDEIGLYPSEGLYSCKLDGTGILRLTANPASVADPYLMPDGRLLFATWLRRLHGRPERRVLFEVNIDGTDYALFAGEQGPQVKGMPCLTSDGFVVFVESEAERADGAGSLARVSLRRNLYSYRRITQPADGLFHSPAPLPDGTLLVSRRPADGGATFAVCRLEPATGSWQPVFDDPALHDLQARVVAPRPEPDGRSTSVLRRTGEIEDPHALETGGAKRGAPETPSGRLYCLDAYNSRPLRPDRIEPGTIRRLRVLEAVPARAPAPARRRFLGEVPVEADGSFNLQVPAGVPVELQLLDADGLALESCAWIWVQNNEPRGCIGCHEDPELVPENRLVEALEKPSIALTLPPERRRTVDFRHDVLPIVRSRCVACHGEGGSPPRLGNGPPGKAAGAEEAGYRNYLTLLASPELPGSAGEGGRYVTPGRARTSPLIWHIFGRNTSRPWDADAAGSQVRAMPAAGAAAPTGDEKQTLIEWIDTGAAWDNRTEPAPTASGANPRSRPQP